MLDVASDSYYTTIKINNYVIPKNNSSPKLETRLELSTKVKLKQNKKD